MNGLEELQHHKGFKRPQEATKENFLQRLIDKIIKKDDCWIWVGHMKEDTFPNIIFYVDEKGKRIDVNPRKFLFNARYGYVPKRVSFVTTCHEFCCVNPEHLKISAYSNRLQIETKSSWLEC